MYLNLGRFLVLSSAFAACGIPNGTKIDDKSDSKSSETRIQESESNPELRQELLPPQDFGGIWQRKLTLAGADGAYMTLDRRRGDKAPWEAIGYLDQEGTFIDDASQAAQYRVGGTLLSSTFEGVQDFIYRQNQCVKEVNAKRIIVSKGAQIIVGACSMEWRADEIIIEGSVATFAPNLRGGQNAGTLKLDALKIHGRGSVLWVGQNGRNGAPGSPGYTMKSDASYSGGNGTNGGDGANGQSGGNGGSIILITDSFDGVDFRVEGGESGAPGLGGAGGKGGPKSCYDIEGDKQVHTFCGHDGVDGKPGRPGYYGSRGRDGVVTQLRRSAL